jgi:hypothetical protein
MKRSLPIFLLVLCLLSPAISRAAPVEINNSPALQTITGGDVDVSLRLIGGRGAVLMPGRDINLTFQTSDDAYVIIYNIDSEGYVHLLYPADGRPEMVRGKKVHFLPEQGGTTWEVGGKTGIEYIHAVAVTDPSRIDRDELYYLAQNSVMPEDRRLRIDMDPFLAFNMIDEELIGEAERAAPSTDYTYFYINREVEYPGYLCYKCHSPSKIPDPYEMECPEVDIEMIAVNEDAGYPYPQLFAVIQAGDPATGDDYDSYTYYADNLALGDDGYDYDEQKVYLSVYYTNSWYPYCGYWPGYWSWYNTCYPSSWYWNISWGIGWGWGGGYYCHHYPFYSWYGGWYHHGWYHGGYHAYWHGYNHGYWDGYWAGGGHGGYYAPANKRSLYAGRTFTKRGALDYGSTRVKKPVGSAGTRDMTRRGSLAYTSTRVKKSREATLASSRLVKERTRTATARSYRNSRLAKQVTRERASTGFRSFETSRYGGGGAIRTGNPRVYGNYGSGRSARSSNQSSTRATTRTRDRTGESRGDLKVDKGDRRYERSTTGSTRSRGGTRRESTGSQLEKRVRQRRESRESGKTDVQRNTQKRSPSRRKSSTRSNRSGSSARSKRDSDSGSSTKSSPSKSSSRKNSSRDSGTRKSSSSSSSPSRSTTRSSGSRSSGSRSSGSRSGGRSGGRSSGKSSGRKR